MDNILMQLAQGGIAFSVLVFVVLYLKAEIKKKDTKIDELQNELREDQKEYLGILFKVVAFMEQGDKNFEDLKAFISDKINSLNNEK